MSYEDIAKSGKKFVLMITGGGQEAIGELLRQGGMSSSLLEATVPYSHAALRDYLRGSFDRAVSRETALAGAMAAFQRARKLAPDDDYNLVGIAATSVLTTGKGERSGREHRSFIAVQTRFDTRVYSYCIPYGRRVDQEAYVTGYILDAIEIAAGYMAVYSNGMYSSSAFGRDTLLEPGAKFPGNFKTTGVMMPSNCNPLGPHHLAIIDHAFKTTGRKVDVELCVNNADKPPLDYITTQERMRAFNEISDPGLGRMVLTSAPLFIDKARLFPNTTFVVGTDTIKRFADPKYKFFDHCNYLYGHGNRFLVYPRKGVDFDHMTLPMEVRRLCTFVSDSNYTPTDLSSTEIRNGDRSLPD